MKRILLGLVAVVAVVMIAVGIWQASRTASPPASAPQAAQAQAAATTAKAPPPAVKPVAATLSAPSSAAEPPQLAFERLDRAAPYDEYLVLSPAVKPALRVEGRSLCLAGLAFGVSYQAELRAGLPAAGGLKLAASQKVEIGLANRPPLVAFRDGMILPRDNAAGVPITTINVAKVAIKLMRVPDRLLSQISS